MKVGEIVEKAMVEKRKRNSRNESKALAGAFGGDEGGEKRMRGQKNDKEKLRKVEVAGKG